MTSDRLLVFADFEVDLTTQELKKGGAKVPLEIQPFKVLGMLLERRGNVVTREEIKQALWSNSTFVDFDNAINTAIRKIRRALHDSATDPLFVETLPRLGYRFIFVPEPVKIPIRSIAVLPLQNVSGNPDQEYFSDGLTDALITNLAKIAALKVISRTSVMQFKGTQKPVGEIAPQLGVDAIVEGSVLREGNRVRVTAQLIEAATDHHLWAENYEREITSVLALQSQIAREVARQVQVQLTPQDSLRLSGEATVNPEAYEAYLRGRSRLHEFTPEGIRLAYKYFEAARQTDSGSALAYSGLAETLFFSLILALAAPREAGPKGLAAAERAIELDASLAQGHIFLAVLKHYYEWDWRGAEAAFGKALDLNPGCADAYIHCALLLTCLGRYEEASQHLRRGLELDPLNLLYQHIYGMQLLWSGKPDDAISQLSGVIAKAPNMQMTHMTMWAALSRRGDEEEALSAALKAWSVVGDEEMVQALKEGNAKAGYREAMRCGAEKLAVRAQTIYVQPHIPSLFFDAAGDTESVFFWLERGYEERDPAMAYFNRKPFSERVKTDPRYDQWLRRLDLPR